MLRKHAEFAAMYWRYRRILRRVEGDATPRTDAAMKAVQSSDLEELELFTATPAARQVAERKLRHLAVPVRIAK
jgi:hypothetical protein